MKSYVGSILDRGGRNAYEGWLFRRLWDFFDEARDDEFWDIANLSQLEALDPLDLLAHGTPFFWMNVRRFRSVAEAGSRTQAARDVVMTGFDSYFHLLPDGACFSVPRAERETLVLPRLGISIPGISQARLRRLDARTLEVEAAAQSLTIDLKQRSESHRARTWNVFEEGPETVIAIVDLAVTTPDTAATMASGEMHAFSTKLACALRLIDSIDSELARSIRNLIHWFVPLIMPSPSFYSSYSERDMIGVIHLSEAYSGLRLCEAIIHEFHHNELFVLEATQRLAVPDGETRYYSPWRPDPRPLSGLLHALHVFSGIARFFERAESSAQEDLDRGEVHHTRSELCQKLRIAISQTPKQSLTSLGEGFLQEIDDDLMRQERELGLRPDRVSDAVSAHARTWCHENPGCMEHLHWPGGVRELIDYKGAP